MLTGRFQKVGIVSMGLGCLSTLNIYLSVTAIGGPPIILCSGMQLSVFKRFLALLTITIHFSAYSSRTHACIVLTPLKPHFYTVKLGFIGVYFNVLISFQNIGCEYF